MSDLSVAIIAGGAARRLAGRVKAQVEVGGRSILAGLLELAPTAPVIVVTQQPQAFPGLTCVGDVVAGKGAPGGVVTALLSASTDWVLVVAGDMPRLHSRHVDTLRAARRDDVEVVVATRGDSLEPLFALYRRSLGAAWLPRLETNPSLRELIGSVSHVRVALYPEVLDSINTPEDLARLGGS